MTALMLASSKGNLDAVQVLLRGGADVNKEHPVSLFLNIIPLINYTHRGVVGQPSFFLPKRENLMCLENCCVKEQ